MLAYTERKVLADGHAKRGSLGPAATWVTRVEDEKVGS